MLRLEEERGLFDERDRWVRGGWGLVRWMRLAEGDPSQPVRIAHKRSEYLISITLPVSHPEMGGSQEPM